MCYNKWSYIILWSLSFTLWFILGILHSMGVDKYIIACIHHYKVNTKYFHCCKNTGFYLLVFPSPLSPINHWSFLSLSLFFFKISFIYFSGGEGERERNINVWLTVMRPLGTWPATQACALTGNQTSNPLLHSLVLNPLSHTSQGTTDSFIVSII